MTSFLIAYWGKYKDVMFTDFPLISPHTSIYTCMQNRLVNGVITEILEYWPNTNGQYNHDDANTACDRWRETLRELGYDMGDEACTIQS